MQKVSIANRSKFFNLKEKNIWKSQGNYPEAQRLYEKAILKIEKRVISKNISEEELHNIQCYAGIARTSIKLGDITRGYNIANELNDPQVILNSIK